MARNNNKNDSRRYYDWLHYAKADIEAANLLSESEETMFLAAFHCQQSMEKTLKSYFLFDVGYAPDGHNIIYLCRKLSKINRDFLDWIDECIDTNNYYVSTRYPPDIPLELDSKKLRHLIDCAERLYYFTYALIDEENGEENIPCRS